MKFWDSSALVPLIVREAGSAWARRLFRRDPSAIVWTLSQTEVRSALARRQREQVFTRRAFSDAKRRAEELFSALSHVVVLDLVCERALRLLDLHDLRAAEALQLAAALVASGERPQALPFVSLDERLADAAEREGFAVESV